MKQIRARILQKAKILDIDISHTKGETDDVFTFFYLGEFHHEYGPENLENTIDFLIAEKLRFEEFAENEAEARHAEAIREFSEANPE